jgi:hypothetical protein
MKNNTNQISQMVCVHVCTRKYIFTIGISDKHIHICQEYYNSIDIIYSHL